MILTIFLMLQRILKNCPISNSPIFLHRFISNTNSGVDVCFQVFLSYTNSVYKMYAFKSSCFFLKDFAY